MIPSKFRHHSGTKSPKSPSGSSTSPRFPSGFHSGLASGPMPGSIPGALPGSMPGSNGYQKPQQAMQGGPKPMGNPPRPSPPPPQASQPLPRQRGGAPPPIRSMVTPDPRRVIVDHIIRDCYSKAAVVDGRKVPEVKYNTHLLIREYSSYPSSPPPSDLSPAQIGAVKSRILVVCTKHTGRVLLQKGKYNDQKKVYQIGRTWDLDELTCVTRAAPDAFVLSLNKDYYWKSGDDPDRLQKFVHHLAVIYQRFTGHFPAMNGFTLESLGLLPAAEIGHSEGSFKPREVTKKPSVPAPNPQPAYVAAQKPSADLYKDMDFTVNGTLPVKPMQIMDVDRSAPSTATMADSYPSVDTTHQSADSSNFRSTLESSISTKESTSGRLGETSVKSTVNAAPETETQSFTFLPEEAFEDKMTSMPTISEYARKNGSSSPLRTFRPDLKEEKLRDVSDNFETAAAYGMQLEDQLTDSPDARRHIEPRSSAHEESQLKLRDKDIDSIEEGSLSESSIETQAYVASQKKKLSGKQTVRKDSVFDDSIREIENFMASQFGKESEALEDNHTSKSIETHSRSPSKSLARKLSEPLLLEENEHETQLVIPNVTSEVEHSVQPVKAEGLSKVPQRWTEVKVETDAETEELLDGIGWNPTDGSDQCVKLLRKELAFTKHKNISELTTLDFGKDSLSNEVKTSAKEIDNLVEIFKRMEVSFKMIAPQVSSIEHNSKGLQIEAVNKKILFNELNEIMSKVKLSDRDLRSVANYEEFDDASMVPVLEGKLLMLYDALGAIGSKKSDDDLSQMQALKQFHERYEQVSLSFAEKFSAYIMDQFRLEIEHLNKEVSNFSPHKVLPAFRKSFTFAGINLFVKCISEYNFVRIIDNFNAYAANLMDNFLGTRIKAIHTGGNSARNSRLASNSELLSGLKKNKSSRFGSTRLIGRHAGVAGDSKSKSIEPIPGNSDEINDFKIIIQMAKESTEFMLVFQYFLGTFFHLASEEDFSSFLKGVPHEERIVSYENGDVDAIDYKTNSNDLLKNMNLVFGNYINRFSREFTPADSIITHVIVGLHELLSDTESRDQDFVAYSFLSKLIEKYKFSWDRFISSQVDLFHKSDVRAKGDVLPVVRNLSQIIATTESALLEAQTSRSDLTEIYRIIENSYDRLTRAAEDMFSRDDPLLKSNTHDEKERAYRNVAILQNLYSILQQLGAYDSSSSRKMSDNLEGVFKTTENEYFDYVIRMHVGKIGEFVYAHSNGDTRKSKKEDKILVRGLIASHTSRDMANKISDMLRKLEKHVISSDTVFEHDLLDLLWKNLERVIEDVFHEFHLIAKGIDKDLDDGVTPGEIRRLFNQERLLK